MSDEEIERRLLKIEALHVIQAADVSALHAVLAEICKNLSGENHQDLPNVDERFLHWRKKILHYSLEELEKANPQKAAILQQKIDEIALNYPFDYDED